jgi:hypothetical protein
MHVAAQQNLGQPVAQHFSHAQLALCRTGPLGETFGAHDAHIGDTPARYNPRTLVKLAVFRARIPR